MSGTLLLFPNVLGEESSHRLFLPKIVMQEMATIDGLIAESEKEARLFLKQFEFANQKTFRDIPIVLFNEHTREHDLIELLRPIKEGQRWGLISDCGLPCLADPGAQMVAKAYQWAIPVKAFPGPSSITLALMLSGLSGQAFTFYGYLPKDLIDLMQKITRMEKFSRKEGMTQIFIEAPYRNQKLLENLLNCLADTTTLCVAWDLTLPTEQVISRTVADWKEKAIPKIDKKPAIFLFCAKAI